MIEDILILVKTYPVLSEKYTELVCTAGITRDGEWRRIFPVPYRQMDGEQQYKKYQWIRAKTKKAQNDERPESYNIDIESVEPLGEPLDRKQLWQARREAFFDRVSSYSSLAPLIELTRDNSASLGLYRPAKILEFLVEEDEREWNADALAKLEAKRQQQDLFEDFTRVQDWLKIVNKLPYKFYYQLLDADGQVRKMMIEDWEIGALYWNCLKAANGNEEIACQKVREKYFDKFVLSGEIEVNLIVGTTFRFHRMNVPNPFVIIGVAPLPISNQQTLF